MALSPPSAAEQRRPAVELRVDGSSAGFEATGAAVRAVAVADGLQTERATRLQLVVEELAREACGRESAGSDRSIGIDIRVEGGRLEVAVSDTRLPVDAAESASARSRQLAALGFVDELEIGSHGRAGNRSVCTVALDPGDLAAAGEDVIAADAPTVSSDDAERLSIRAMTSGDALGLARCIYRCYGYTYKDPLLYEPAHIAEAIADRSMRSVVAASADGEIVGHVGLFLERPWDRMPEAGKLVVDPRFRGHHLGERMARERLELARATGLAGYWSQAVVNHPASQKEVVRQGGAEVGLLIGASPATVRMADMKNTNEGRRTLLACYTPLRTSPLDIHLPERHAGFVAGLAERLGLERRISCAAAAATGPTELRTRVAAESGLGRARVERIGADAAERVFDALEGFDAFDLGAFHIDVPIAQPGAAALAECLERVGFSFGAWLPTFDASGDVLRLQRVGSHPVDVAHIVCARPEGEQVRDHVIAEWRRVRRGEVG